MSSSDSDSDSGRGRAVRGRPARGGKVAANSDSSDSDDDKPTQQRAVRGGRRAQAKDESESDSDSDDDAAPAPRRGGGRAAKSDTDDTDTDEDAGDSAPVERKRQVQLWLPINYDDMSQDTFYDLLKEKSRQNRQEEKRMAEQQAENNKGEAEEPIESFIDESNIDVDDCKGYKYSEMLQRIYTELRAKNPELGDGSHKRVKLPVPKTEKASTKTTALSNFKEMCKAMNRDMDHVKDFIEKELTTSTSVDGNFCLIMKVRNVKAMQIEHVFQKYVEEYCQCGNCGGIDTLLEKNPVNRLWVLKCKSCKASRTVQAAANATYKAQIGRRKHL